MARGFNAGERGIRIDAGLGNRTTFTTYVEEGDRRSPEQRQSDAAKIDRIMKEFERVLDGGVPKGFGAGEEARTVAWMPKADELPSKVRAGSYDSSEEAASADGRAIFASMPTDVRQSVQDAVTKERERMEKNAGEANENGVSAKVLAALEKSNPDAYEAMKNITTRIAVARSADIKKEIEAKTKSSDHFQDLFEDSWKAARDAFNSADSVAKMVLKKGDESYGESREFVGTKGFGGDAKEVVGSLKNGEPSVNGRVLAVNSGILMAKRAVEDVIKKMTKEYDKLEKKNPGLMKGPISEQTKDDVRRLVMEKMIADKSAFLSVRGYIPPTAIYVGPTNGNTNPVQHINPARGKFTRDIPGGGRIGLD